MDTPESCVDPEDTNSGLISEKIQPTPEKTDRAPADTLSLPAQWKPISKTTISENKPTESVCKDINKETLSVTEKSELVTKATVSLPETSSVTMETGPASVKSVLATKETGEVPVKIGSVTKEIQSVPEIGSVNKMTGSVTKMTGSVTKEIGTVANGQLPNTPSDPQEDLVRVPYPCTTYVHTLTHTITCPHVLRLFFIGWEMGPPSHSTF